MANKILVINGSNFTDLSGFYDEIERVLTGNLGGKMGRNLDAFNDVLRGGFGVYEHEESIKLIWENSNKSKVDLGYAETVKYLEKILKECHQSNKEKIQKELNLAKDENGPILFDHIIEIINGQSNHIKLILND